MKSPDGWTERRLRFCKLHDMRDNCWEAIEHANRYSVDSADHVSLDDGTPGMVSVLCKHLLPKAICLLCKED